MVILTKLTIPLWYKNSELYRNTFGNEEENEEENDQIIIPKNLFINTISITVFEDFINLLIVCDFWGFDKFPDECTNWYLQNREMAVYYIYFNLAKDLSNNKLYSSISKYYKDFCSVNVLKKKFEIFLIYKIATLLNDKLLINISINMCLKYPQTIIYFYNTNLKDEVELINKLSCILEILPKAGVINSMSTFKLRVKYPDINNYKFITSYIVDNIELLLKNNIINIKNFIFNDYFYTYTSSKFFFDIVIENFLRDKDLIYSYFDSDISDDPEDYSFAEENLIIFLINNNFEYNYNILLENCDMQINLINDFNVSDLVNRAIILSTLIKLKEKTLMTKLNELNWEHIDINLQINEYCKIFDQNLKVLDCLKLFVDGLTNDRENFNF